MEANQFAPEPFKVYVWYPTACYYTGGCYESLSGGPVGLSQVCDILTILLVLGRMFAFSGTRRSRLGVSCSAMIMISR